MRIKLLNIYVDNVTMSEAVSAMDELIKKKDHSYVVTPNLDHIVKVEEDPTFREVYENASLVLTDGKPLLWIAKYLGTPIKEKVSGSDIFPKLCEMAAHRGYSVFILGAAEGVATEAAENLRRIYPGLIVAGTYSPPLGFEKDEEMINQIVDMVNSTKADILAVALGSPKGEKFIYRIRTRVCVSLSISIGATIDFIAGRVKRAPKWISAIGFEWLFRITQDPKRLIKRYWKDACSIVPILRKYKQNR